MILNKTYDELKSMRKVLETERMPVGTSVALLLVDQLISAIDDLEEKEQQIQFLESSLDDLRYQLTVAHSHLAEE